MAVVLTNKMVVIIATDAPIGVALNTAALLGVGLGRHHDGTVGPDTADAAGTPHTGMCAYPIPILRADDLLGSTARQILLQRMLGAEHVPTYGHLPLVLAAGGQRLAKRNGGTTIRELIAGDGGRAPMSPAQLLGALARGLGLSRREGPLTPQQVAASLEPPSRWRRDPWSLDLAKA